MASPATRGKTAEELEILFVILHSGWQGAMREGQVGPYADGMNRLFRAKTGQNLRRLILTDSGFRAKEQE